jgi:predicted phosphatase
MRRQNKELGKWNAKFNNAKLKRILKNIKYFNIMILSPKRSKGSWLKGLGAILLVLLSQFP